MRLRRRSVVEGNVEGDDELLSPECGSVERTPAGWWWEWHGAGMVGSGLAPSLPAALTELARSQQFTRGIDRGAR